MSKYNRLVAYGSSPIDGTELPNKDKMLAFPARVATALALDYECRGKPLSSNSKIARKVLSGEYTAEDFVFVMFSAPNRYEFKTEQGWNGFTAWSEAKDGLIREWLNGPGKLEYTEVYMTLKEIILVQEFLKKKNLPYLLAIDNNAITDSYIFKNPDNYIKMLTDMIDWNKFQWFNGSGFINWAKENGFPFTGTHAGVEAHKSATDYILTNWKESF
jgi:hypothetical protein